MYIYVDICVTYVCYIYNIFTWVMHVVFAAAEKIMTALRNKAVSGANGKGKGKGKRRAVKEEVSCLFNKKIKPATSFAWKHKFVCLASTDQSRIPTTDVDKEVISSRTWGKGNIF